jgi:hypothetical protein
MLASVNGWALWSAVVALLALLPATSGAQQERAKARQAGEARWVPSLAVISGVTIQSQEASVELFDSNFVLDEDFSTVGDDVAVSPYVGANLELLSPALPLPGRPRLFVGAEILPTFGAERDVAKIGDPSGFRTPLFTPPLPGEEVPRSGYTESGVLGQGSATAAQIDTLVLGAAVGVAFPFELRGRPLRVKPSFGWIRYKIDVEGRVLKVECLPFTTPKGQPSTACIDFDPAGPNAGNPFQPGFTREIVLGAQDSQSFNGIGGGLDIEMDAWRVGQFGISLFLGGRFYRTLGDRTVDLSDSASFDDDLGQDTFTANWSFEVDPWMYRAGLGLRFHWLGSQK